MMCLAFVHHKNGLYFYLFAALNFNMRFGCGLRFRIKFDTGAPLC